MRRFQEMKRRDRIILLLGTTLLLGGFIIWHEYNGHLNKPVRLMCDPNGLRRYPSAPSLPDTHYLISERYGWFDQTHFDTGNPGQILAGVRDAVRGGANTFVVRQGVRDNVTGYSAVYWISRQVDVADVAKIALGIYHDWSIRFETWESQMPRILGAPFSPFAVEDLPSHYLGFYANANNMAIEDVFACFLGPVTGSNDGPPDLISPLDTTVPSDDGIVRLQNRTFTPMVETAEGWKHVEWPDALQMSESTASYDTWLFLSDDTWYLDDQTADLTLLSSAMGEFHLPLVK